LSYDLRNDPILNPAYEYWRSKCGARAMPRRRDIDPTEIPRLLPNIQITELVDGGKRIRFRLAGTAIVEAYGAQLAGKYIDEVFSGKRLSFIEANYRKICSEKRPIMVRNRYHSSRNVELICTRLVMPMSEDGETVNQCLSAMSFQFPGEADEWTGQWFGNSNNFDFEKSYSEVMG
jgi:hypothetical protein